MKLRIGPQNSLYSKPFHEKYLQFQKDLINKLFYKDFKQSFAWRPHITNENIILWFENFYYIDVVCYKSPFKDGEKFPYYSKIENHKLDKIYLKRVKFSKSVRKEDAAHYILSNYVGEVLLNEKYN